MFLLSSAVKFIVLLFHLHNPLSLLHSHVVGMTLSNEEHSTEAEAL